MSQITHLDMHVTPPNPFQQSSESPELDALIVVLRSLERKEYCLQPIFYSWPTDCTKE